MVRLPELHLFSMEVAQTARREDMERAILTVNRLPSQTGLDAFALQWNA